MQLIEANVCRVLCISSSINNTIRTEHELKDSSLLDAPVSSYVGSAANNPTKGLLPFLIRHVGLHCNDHHKIMEIA